MMNEEKFKALVSKNLTNYRKVNNLTQLELAEKLNYSDKSISKWERGESLPDIYTLGVIAAFYGITINDLCMEKEAKRIDSRKTTHLFITLLSVGLVWFVATFVFGILAIILANKGYRLWLAFIAAIPVSFIVLVVFTCLWYSLLLQALSVSGLVWGIAIILDVGIPLANTSLFYIIAGVFQVLVVIWYIMKGIKFKNKRKKKGY